MYEQGRDKHIWLFDLEAMSNEKSGFRSTGFVAEAQKVRVDFVGSDREPRRKLRIIWQAQSLERAHSR